MKVLFWTDGFWPRLGGVETQGYRFITGMQKRGHEYIVLAQRDYAEWKEDEIYKDIVIKRFDFNALITKKELSIMRDINTYLEWVMTEFQPDLIHLNGLVGGSIFAFLVMMKMFCVPIVLTAHAPLFYQGSIPPVVARVLTSVDRICCVSNWVLTSIADQSPALNSKLQLIYNGLPMPALAPTSLDFFAPVILMLGRLAWEKGFDTGIKAFSLLKKSGSNARLMIGGGGIERSNLEKLVDALSLNDDVTFTGVLSDEALRAVYNQATLVVVPSILESFGLVILEAMQLERPVIASCVEGVPEVVSDGETGLLVPPKDPAALHQAMQFLLDQPELAIRMGKQGRIKAEKFSIEKNMDQYEALYIKLTSKVAI